MFSQADGRFVGDDQVVEQGDFEEFARLEEALGYRPVLLGGLLAAARMVVGQDKRGGTALDGPAENVPRIDRALVDRALGKNLG